MKIDYFPILKAKRGEILAINELTDEVWASILPVLQLTEPSQKRNSPPRVADIKYVSEKIKAIKKSVKGRPFILDTSLISLEPELERLIIRYFSNIDFFPLLNISHPSTLFKACLKYDYSPRKICIKLDGNELSDPNAVIRLREAVDSTGYDENNIIFLLDMEDVHAKNINEVLSPVATFLSEIISEFNFQTIVLGAGAFPPSLQGVTPWTYKYYERRDWKLYKALYKNFPQLKYGDYGINTAANSNPGFRGPASIRYTIDENFLIVKSIMPDPLGEVTSEHHRKLSNLIINSNYYKGLTYSWGDNHIHRCTQPLHNTGNPGIWRAVGASHHITLVLEELSRLSYI